ncbi:CPBP family intramembrane glutamic endopeptidase [Garciella nitratireducens]|uniref:CAAX protease self-immunity n=1 Tax=Garciella nitratireducens DSM 15102 TaxID=1121911 RepID=A0A1T4PJT4_9FIRM|nr:CPBP family intramembrane glutamic endopeptidase [Garciella nitratireducens]SJZ91486.1 CAAX protease self-immunity [Garciella nitratireducens DSM 15102]
MSWIEWVQLLLIIIVIGFPPYLAALEIFRKLHPIIFILVSIIYWVGTAYTQQIVPFLLIVILLIKKQREQKKYGQINFYREKKIFHIKDFFSIILFTILLRYPIGILNAFYVYLLDILGISVQQQEIIDIFINSKNILLNVLLFLLVVIVAPINEEFSLRHYFFGKTLSKRVGPVFAALLSSVLFTLLHYNIAGIPTFFLLGLYACYVYTQKGFWGAVTVHFAFNLSSILFLFLL